MGGAPKNSSNSNIKKSNEGKLKTKNKLPDNVVMILTQCAEVGDPPFHTPEYKHILISYFNYLFYRIQLKVNRILCAFSHEPQSNKLIKEKSG